MSDNLPTPAPSQGLTPAPQGSTGGVASTAANAAGAVVAAVGYGIQFTVMVAKLAAAGAALRGVGNRVRETYKYIGDCAKSVDHLADLAANLRPAVDPDTVGEHRDAAKVMRASLARAQRMANTVDEMSVMFDQAKAAHQGDYGAVNDAATSMTVPMANRNFYRNR
ncbi:hypothetical protein OOK44_38200 [Streptomyces cellulosae]|uniref:hypothetical protein n=1 Tax=Streptomyces cellulosae TaxID=1968 RepID=UPI002257B437|nr:hypothetical protein [Streptomyces cellulosae]MCX4482210.1 hypothetical protein [Streptomyces cellulosae]